MPIVHTSSKGQIVIPAKLRRKYSIEQGTRLNVVDGDGEIILRPVLQDAVNQAKGLFRGGAVIHSGAYERAQGG
ncbi:AbrB/MazE/SpoVT family DNA-binding domain-containing protein [Candidatus Zixiibacteriota bacterium]